MPIALDDAQNHHPLMLTRQQNPDKEPLQGEFTLAQLQSRFALENAPEAEVLAEASAQGHAFFKSGDVYVGFAPLPGDAEDLPVDPIEDMDTASLADHDLYDDAEDPEDDEIEVNELEMTIGHPITVETVDELADYNGDDLPDTEPYKMFSDETIAFVDAMPDEEADGVDF